MPAPALCRFRPAAHRMEGGSERQPNGLWIKSVRFKVPLEFDGVSSQDVIIDNDSNSLPNESIDETVLLFVRALP